jgi:hypothetical protein
MKMALLVLLGLVLGAIGGAVLGIGAGLAWVETFKTTSFEGYSGMLVFFTFMPLGAAIGGLGGALLFGVIAARDAQIAVEREPGRRHDTRIGGPRKAIASVQCKIADCIPGQLDYLKLQTYSVQHPGTASSMTPRAAC